MPDMKKLNQSELENVSGGSANGACYIAEILRDGINEEEVEGTYASQSEAFDAASSCLQENLRHWPDLVFIIKVYIYDRASDTKQLVYEERVEFNEYYKVID